jgi:hypothetical protein
VVATIEGRRAALEATPFFAKATADAQQSVLRKVDQAVSRVRGEKQIALVREFGTSFEKTVYPSLLDELVASEPAGDSADPPPPKQTVSITTIAVTGVTGVLEDADDVERYLEALRRALIQTLKDDKRIAL